MKVISFINMKGGVGKTTTVIELAAIFAKEHNKKILVVDLDPQTNATFSLMPLDNWNAIKDTKTIANVLGMKRGFSSRDSEFDINEAVTKNVAGIENLDLIPSHLELTFLDLDLSSQPAREHILSKELKNLSDEYDFVFIDCPPNLTLAPQNALVASHYIIVPVVPEVFPAIGLPLLINRISDLSQRLPNCNPQILGVVFTKVKRGTNIHTQQIDAIRRSSSELNIYAFQTIIPETVRISEAVAQQKPAYIVNPNENGTIAYKNLATEILLMLEQE